jgi:Tfp pilus assembly major pilin PilA
MRYTKGFTLIETIIYIGILSVVIFGIYIEILNLNQYSTNSSINITHYKNLIKNFHVK